MCLRHDSCGAEVVAGSDADHTKCCPGEIFLRVCDGDQIAWHQAEGFGAGLEFDELIARDASVERQQQAARSLREARNTGSIVAGSNLMATQISVIAIGK